MRSRSPIRRLLLTAAIAGFGSATFPASSASAQYFGPRLGVFPGFGIGLPVPPPIAFGPRFRPALPVPGRAIGAIPRWSRAPQVVPVYPVTSYVPRPFVARPLVPVGVLPVPSVLPVTPVVPVTPVMPVGPVSPVAQVSYEYQANALGSLGGSINIDANRIDIRTPGFQYRAERSISAPDIAAYPGSGSLSQSASRLAAALSARPDGDVWLEYLQPERVALTANPAELGELAVRYQGVMANPDLAWLANIDGFQETLQWLDQGSPVSDAEVSGSPTTPMTASPRAGEPTLAPALPGEDADPKEGRQPKPERSIQEELPAPKPEPTTSI